MRREEHEAQKVMRICLLNLTAWLPQKVCVSSVVTCHLPVIHSLWGTETCVVLSCHEDLLLPSQAQVLREPTAGADGWEVGGQRNLRQCFSLADLTLGNDTGCFSLISWFQAWLKFGFLLPHFYPTEARSPRNHGAWHLAKLSLSSC